jgi:hypothetical protein
MLVKKLCGISALLVGVGCGSSGNSADATKNTESGMGGNVTATGTSSSIGGATNDHVAPTGGTNQSSNTTSAGVGPSSASGGAATQQTATSGGIGATTSGGSSANAATGGSTGKTLGTGGGTGKTLGTGGGTGKALGTGGNTSSSDGLGGTTSKATGTGGSTLKATAGGTTGKASTGGSTGKADAGGATGSGGAGGATSAGSTGGSTASSTGPCTFECTDFCLNAGGQIMPGTCEKATDVCCNVEADESSSTGKQFYIDANAGNDTNDGTSPEKAWKSATKIKSASSGGVVNLKRGSVWDVKGAISISNLTVRPYGTGPRPFIRGTNIIVPQSLATVVLTGKAVVDGLKVSSDQGFGAYINGDSNVLRHIEVDGTGTGALMGIGIAGSNNQVTGCYVHDLVTNTGDTGDVNSSGGAEGIVSFTGDHIDVGYNTVARAHCVNKTLGGDEGGCTEIIMNPQFGLTMTDIKYHHNLCVDTVGLFESCQGTGQPGFDPTKNRGTITDVTVAYNVVIDSKWMYLLQIVNTNHKNVVFEHNSIIHGPRNNTQWSKDAMSHYYMWGMMFSSSNGTSVSDSLTADQLIVRNNLFTEPYSKESLFIGVTSGHNNNLFSPSTAKLDSRWTLAATEKKVDDAGLVDTFNLKAGSPAVDTGSAEGLYDTDFYGNPKCGSVPDIGAVEYCENSATKGRADEIAKYLELHK